MYSNRQCGKSEKIAFVNVALEAEAAPSRIQCDHGGEPQTCHLAISPLPMNLPGKP
jgi:hypothetical protein